MRKGGRDVRGRKGRRRGSGRCEGGMLGERGKVKGIKRVSENRKVECAEEKRRLKLFSL